MILGADRDCPDTPFREPGRAGWYIVLAMNLTSAADWATVVGTGVILARGGWYAWRWWRKRDERRQAAQLPDPADQSVEAYRKRARIRFIEWNSRD